MYGTIKELLSSEFNEEFYSFKGLEKRNHTYGFLNRISLCSTGNLKYKDTKTDRSQKSNIILNYSGSKVRTLEKLELYKSLQATLKCFHTTPNSF